MTRVIGRVCVAIAPLLLLAGCGQAANPQRTAVAHYLAQVQPLETGFTKPLNAVSSAGQQFAEEQHSGNTTLGKLALAADEASLRRASMEIAALRSRLAAIEAPAPARHLRVLLLELAARQVELTDEVAGMVTFLPSFATALTPLAPATRRLSSVLAGTSTTGVSAPVADAAKAAALRVFADETRSIAAAVERLHPPGVSRADADTQLASLEGMTRSADRLAGALVAGDTATTLPLLTQFDRAATLDQTLGAQRARIAAVRAYDAKVASVTTLSDAIAVERLRLANTLH